MVVVGTHLITPTVLGMVVDHANALHERVARSRPNKTKARVTGQQHFGRAAAHYNTDKASAVLGLETTGQRFALTPS